MKRVYLSKEAKVVLRHVAGGSLAVPAGFSDYQYRSACLELRNIGFLYVAQIEGGEVVSVLLTEDGRSYLSCNPTLRNPIDYKKLSFVVALASLVVSVVVAFVACVHLSWA